VRLKRKKRETANQPQDVRPNKSKQFSQEADITKRKPATMESKPREHTYLTKHRTYRKKNHKKSPAPSLQEKLPWNDGEIISAYRGGIPTIRDSHFREGTKQKQAKERSHPILRKITALGS